MAEALKLRERDQVEIQVDRARTLAVPKSPSNQERLGRLRKSRGRLPEGFHFDWPVPNERDWAASYTNLSPYLLSAEQAKADRWTA